MNLLQIVKATGDAFIARAVESVKTDAGTTVDSRVNLRTSEDRMERTQKRKYVNDHQKRLVMVNPFSVKKIKELDDNSPKKTDSKDPKTIAKLVVDGRYSIPYMPEGIYAEIRDLVYSREPIWII